MGNVREGTFDTVMVPCPSCGITVDFDTQKGPCNMERYMVTDAPPAIAGALHARTETCKRCGTIISLHVAYIIHIKTDKLPEDDTDEDDRTTCRIAKPNPLL